jgi:hypothetical protein
MRQRSVALNRRWHVAAVAGLAGFWSSVPASGKEKKVRRYCEDQIICSKGVWFSDLTGAYGIYKPMEYLERNSFAVDVLQNATDKHDQFS